MKPIFIIAGWLVVTLIACFLRFDELEVRPMHFDEATGARVTAARMEAEGGKFDPKHGHGPLLWNLGGMACHLRGEKGWHTMRESTLRAVPALAGVLVVLLPLGWRKKFGDPASLLMAGLLATSPLLVYYSRMFIHEMLLVACGIAVMTACIRGPRWLAAGIWTGLMFAAKESAAISVIAWTVVIPFAASHRREFGDWLTSHWRRILLAGVTTYLVAALLYTDWLRHPRGALDMLLTFFVYETVPGHEKPASWYFSSLLWSSSWQRSAWIHASLLMLAITGCIIAWKPHLSTCPRAKLVRWIGGATAIHFIIYSSIGYKTPWLACLPWAMVCLLVGAISSLPPVSHRKTWQTLLAVLIIVVIGASLLESRKACGRLSVDPRNPYVYVPTRTDVIHLADWLERLRAKAGAGEMDAVAVVGSSYWPLPWYLRSFAKAGYFVASDQGWESFPLIIAMPEAMEVASQTLAATHIALPRGLRDGVPIVVFLKHHLWEQWMQAK